jgi:Gas vesicle protein
MNSVAAVASQRTELAGHASREVTLIDLLDRLLQGGIVVQGDITLAVADIDLVDLSLRLVVGAVDAVGRDLRGPIQPEAR